MAKRISGAGTVAAHGRWTVTCGYDYTKQDRIESLPPGGLPKYMVNWLAMTVDEIERVTTTLKARCLSERNVSSGLKWFYKEGT